MLQITIQSTYFMQEQLFQNQFKEDLYSDGLADEKKLNSSLRTKLLIEHPIDIQFIGIGTMVNIGFNERERHLIQQLVSIFNWINNCI